MGLILTSFYRGNQTWYYLRVTCVASYVEEVYTRWSAAHGPTIARWYEAFVDGAG